MVRGILLLSLWVLIWVRTLDEGRTTELAPYSCSAIAGKGLMDVAASSTSFAGCMWGAKLCPALSGGNGMRELRIRAGGTLDMRRDA